MVLIDERIRHPYVKVQRDENGVLRIIDLLSTCNRYPVDSTNTSLADKVKLL